LVGKLNRTSIGQIKKKLLNRNSTDCFNYARADCSASGVLPMYCQNKITGAIRRKLWFCVNSFLEGSSREHAQVPLDEGLSRNRPLNQIFGAVRQRGVGIACRAFASFTYGTTTCASCKSAKIAFRDQKVEMLAA